MILINKKLNEFYGPIQQLRKTSKDLHDLFKNGETFRTLTELLKGTEYTNNDGALLTEILEIDKQTGILISNKSELIDDEELYKTLTTLNTHYRILDLAYQNKISGEIERFEKFVFPNKIDDLIEARIKELKDQLSALSK
jgi:hypothetical protein